MRMIRRNAAIVALAIGLVSVATSATASAATYTLPDGYTIDVLAPGLPADPARDQLFVGLLGSLVHGAEIDLLTVQLTANEPAHTAACGGAAGCYKTLENALYVRGYRYVAGDPDGEPLTSADQLPRGLIAHEFGHHVANHRRNPGELEGDALANGTKRWASYMQICPRVRSGALGKTYQASPAEGFAESYRALHFPENLGFWFLDELLRPDQRALDLIREDVLDPWEGPTGVVVRGRFAAGGKDSQRKRLALPLDGELSASLTTTGSLEAKLALVDGRKPLARGSGPKQRLDHEVCGTRAAKLVIKRLDGRGKFKVNALRP